MVSSMLKGFISLAVFTPAVRRKSELATGDVVIANKGSYDRALAVPPAVTGSNMRRDVARTAPLELTTLSENSQLGHSDNAIGHQLSEVWILADPAVRSSGHISRRTSDRRTVIASSVG